MIIGTPFLNAILKSFLLILLFILTSLKGKAQEDVNLQWIKSFGGQVHQIGHSTTLDSDGNIYTTGLFKGIVDFDPGTDTVNLTSIGFKDAFVLKLDSNGNYIWAVSIEGSVIERGQSITIDNEGNCYLTGYFEGTVDFDPGTDTANLTSNGNQDIFILKLDPNGEYIWAKSFGSDGTDNVFSITTDYQNNSYILGNFGGSVNFESNATNLTNDSFVLKLDDNGDYIWVITIDTERDVSGFKGSSLAVDGNGNCYVTGHYYGTIDIDPGTDTVSITTNGRQDIVVLKLDPNGNYIWAKPFGSGGTDTGVALKIDKNGNCYLMGHFGSLISFHFNGSSVDIITNGRLDVFVLKLDVNGDFIWVKSLGGQGSDVGNSLILDNEGNCYVNGYFEGTVDFDPGAATENITSKDERDVFVLKLDVNGDYLWAKSFNNTFNVSISSIAVSTEGNSYITGSFSDFFALKLDPNGDSIWTKSFGTNGFQSTHSTTIDNYGNIYITGVFNGKVDFDPSSNTINLTSISDKDIFILKLDPKGDYIWVKSFNGKNCSLKRSITIDNQGNCFITGVFSGTVDFDPSADTVNLSSNGNNDYFFLKLAPNGDYIQVMSLGTQDQQFGNSSVKDNEGNSYITGSFYGTVDFDPSSNTVNLTSNGYLDIFVLKLNPNGEFIWVKSFGQSDIEYGKSIAIDNEGNCYVVGRFENKLNFNHNTDTISISSNGYADVFVLKLNTNGEFFWVKSFGGQSSDFGNSIATDYEGNSYITGSFHGTVDFDPSDNMFNLTSKGSSDAFVLKLNPNGGFIWAESFGNSGIDFGRSITIDNKGNNYTIGEFQGTVDFDPSPKTVSITSNGSSDVFILKLKNCHFNNCIIDSDDTYRSSAATDNTGNKIITSTFSETVDFDTSTQKINLTSNGGTDVFTMKLDTNENYIWAKSFGGYRDDFVNNIAIDNQGNSFTTGGFQGTIDYDMNVKSLDLVSNGRLDVFVSKRDINGDNLWNRSFGGTDGDYGVSITTDFEGNSYITGLFQGTVDFDPSDNTFNLTSKGRSDIFILKLDVNGDYIWAKSFGGPEDDFVKTITVDNQGNSYISGGFLESISFDTGINTIDLLSTGGLDIFILKLDTNGDCIWTKSFGGPEDDFGSSVTIDDNGSSYITGEFQGTVNFDPSTNSVDLTSNGGFDVFVLKLDAAGNYIWDKSIGGSSKDVVNSVTLDGQGNSYVLGGFQGVVQFDGFTDKTNLTSNGGLDIFVLKLDADGDYIWANSFGGLNDDFGTSITLDQEKGKFIIGEFQGTVDFDGGIDVKNMARNGDYDIYVLKLNDCYFNNSCLAQTKSTGLLYTDKIIISPNPTKGVVIINKSNNNKLKVEILNSTGKVKEIVINKKTTQIDLSLFSSGVFIFKMTTKNNVSIQKIIVL